MLLLFDHGTLEDRFVTFFDHGHVVGVFCENFLKVDWIVSLLLLSLSPLNCSRTLLINLSFIELGMLM